MLHGLGLRRVGSDDRFRAIRVLPDHIPPAGLRVEKVTKLRVCHSGNMSRLPQVRQPDPAAGIFDWTLSKAVQARGA